MGRARIALSGVANEAAHILGQHVRVGRHNKNWTAAELAARAGVSERTVLAIESGSASVSFGHVLNVAALVDVPLFGSTDRDDLTNTRRRGEKILALLPSKVYHARRNDNASDYDF